MQAFVRPSASLATMALLVATFIVGPFADQVRASERAQEWGPWRGSVSISSAETIMFGDPVRFTRTGTGSYADVSFSGDNYQPGGQNSYRADVDITMHETHHGDCNNGPYPMTTDWAYSGPSEGAYEGPEGAPGFGVDGVVLTLDDRSDGSGTYVAPHFVIFNGDKHFPACGPFDASVMKQSNDTMSIYAGHNYWVTDPLVDADPDPAHLKGTMSWSLGNYPDGAPPFTYSAYSYTFSYDLTREPWGSAACSDGIDNDGDGAIDDGDDPGCNSAIDPSEFGTNECDNGTDDDGDTFTDFRVDGSGDRDCTGPADVSETDEACLGAAARDRHFTVVDATAAIDMALSPDPDLGTLSMAFHWCMTENGPHIMEEPLASNPYGGWIPTDNWLLLGGLEAFGALTLAEGTTDVVHGNISSSVSMKLAGKLNALELVLSVIPVGKVLEPVSKVLKKYSSKLNPLTKALRKYAAEIAAATKKVDSLALKSAGQEKRLGALAGDIAKKKNALKKANTAKQRKKLTRQIGELQSTKKAVEAELRTTERQAKDARADLVRDRAEKAKVARAINDLLQKITAPLRAAARVYQALRRAIDEKVDSIRNPFARELLKEVLETAPGAALDAALEASLEALPAAIDALDGSKLEKLLTSNSGTDALMAHLENVYRKSIGRITAIDVPIWDGNILAVIDGDGAVTVTDESTSHLIFTVHTDQVVTTS